MVVLLEIAIFGVPWGIQQLEELGISSCGIPRKLGIQVK